MKPFGRRASLLGKMGPAAFSPLYVNEALFEGRQGLALYKFARIFFPQLGPGLLNLLLDMENQSRRVIAAVPPEKRRRLINELDGVTVEMRYTIKDRNREMFSLPITLRPAEVLKQAMLGKPTSPDRKRQQKEINRLIMTLIEKEIRGNMKHLLEACLKTLIVKPRLPVLLKELIRKGWVNKDGRLAEDVTIMDLMSGRYTPLFKKMVPEDIINETLLIHKTIKACCDRQKEDADYPALMHEALRAKRTLEITLATIKQKPKNKDE